MFVCVNELKFAHICLFVCICYSAAQYVYIYAMSVYTEHMQHNSDCLIIQQYQQVTRSPGNFHMELHNKRTRDNLWTVSEVVS